MSMAGKDQDILSKRSVIPPCPGKMLPKSLIRHQRFTAEAKRSPAVDTRLIIKPATMASAMDAQVLRFNLGPSKRGK